MLWSVLQNVYKLGREKKSNDGTIWKRLEIAAESKTSGGEKLGGFQRVRSTDSWQEPDKGTVQSEDQMCAGDGLWAHLKDFCPDFIDLSRIEMWEIVTIGFGEHKYTWGQREALEVSKKAVFFYCLKMSNVGKHFFFFMM